MPNAFKGVLGHLNILAVTVRGNSACPFMEIELTLALPGSPSDDAPVKVSIHKPDPLAWLAQNLPVANVTVHSIDSDGHHHRRDVDLRPWVVRGVFEGEPFDVRVLAADSHRLVETAEVAARIAIFTLTDDETVDDEEREYNVTAVYRTAD